MSLNSTYRHTVMSALVYMFFSLVIIFSNKLVLTTYRFPSYIMLAMLQTFFTFFLIQIIFSSNIRTTEVPELFRKIFPLAMCSALDIVMGIAGTGSLSLPLFTALRRISNLFIMVGEHILLGTRRNVQIHCSVVIMVIGAIVAAIGDITFDILGYTYIIINNLTTTGKALFTRSRLRDYNFSSLELLYFNSLFMLPILLIATYLQCDFEEIFNFEHWKSPRFLLCFIFSCCSAVALNYSQMQCTRYTSALTTSILGVIKNIIVTYAGMFVGGDYVYTGLNFTGVTIGAIGATLYVILTYHNSKAKSGANLTPK